MLLSSTLLQLDEYKSTSQSKTSEVLPNVINLSYSNYEYEGDFYKKKGIDTYIIKVLQKKKTPN